MEEKSYATRKIPTLRCVIWYSETKQFKYMRIIMCFPFIRFLVVFFSFIKTFLSQILNFSNQFFVGVTQTNRCESIVLHHTHSLFTFSQLFWQFKYYISALGIGWG